MEQLTLTHKIIEKTSLTLSTIFSPILVPTYACALALWITPLSLVPERVRLMISLIIFAITAIVPMGTILFLIRSGKVSDAAISNRGERAVPYLITGLCYVCAAVFLNFKHSPHWLSLFYGGAAFAVLVALVVNSKWKISAHGTVMGGLCAMVLFIAMQGMAIVKIMPWLTAAFLCAGAVGSSRLFLSRHTPAQVYAGFMLGLLVEYLFMCI